MLEGSHRWPIIALTALAMFAPFNVRLSSSAWTDLQLRILIVLGLVLVVAVVVDSLMKPRSVAIDWIDGLCLWWLIAIWASAAISESPLLGSGGAARLSIPILLIPATRRAVRSAADITLLLRGLAIGAVLGALVGLTVWLLGSRVDPTLWFVGEVTSLGPFDRLTRPWAHANVAAMALGATAAATAALRPRPLALAALAVVTTALVLTISRGGLLAAAAAGVAWIALRRRRTESLVVLALFALASVVFLSSSAWSARTDQLGDEAFYNVSIAPPPAFTIGGDDDQLVVTLTNRSSMTWPKKGSDRVLISARWFGPDGQIWTEDKWELPRDLAPGETLDAYLSIEPRLPVGDDYRVRWDAHIPNTAYFGQFLGLPPVVSHADILRSDVLPNHFARYPLVERNLRLNRVDTWRLAWQEFKDNPLLGVGPNQFGDAATDDLLSTNRQVGSHAHNIVLEPLATWGLFGSLPFFALIAAALIQAIRRAAHHQTIATVVVATGLIAVASHGAVDWPLVVVTTAIPVGTLLGLALTPLQDEHVQAPESEPIATELA